MKCFLGRLHALRVFAFADVIVYAHYVSVFHQI